MSRMTMSKTGGGAAALAAALALAGCAATLPEAVYGRNFPGPAVDPARPSFFPERALEAQVQGYVIMMCVLKPGGRLEQCAVAFESQPGWGFGEAALRLSAEMVVGSHPDQIGRRVAQPAYFCLDETYCAQARAAVDVFRQAGARRRAAAPSAAAPPPPPSTPAD